MKKFLAAACVIAAFCAAAPQIFAQYQITTLGGTVTENFASYSGSAAPTTTGTNGWVMNSSSTLTFQNQGNGSGTAGGVWSYGVVNNTERALGFLGSSGAGVNMNAFAEVQNNVSSGTVTSLVITWSGEMWRSVNGSTATITVAYAIGSKNVTTAAGLGALTWTNLNTYTPTQTANASGSLLNSQSFNSGSISLASFNNNQSVYFRVYYLGGSGSRSGLAIDDISVTFNGTAPVGTSVYWTADGSTLGGAGTWNTSGSNWSASDVSVSGATWDSSKTAVFSGASGAAITVDTVSANKGIQFTTTGYTLSSGTITLGGATAADNALTASDAVTATIDSVLDGSSALAKNGTGTIILGGNNTYSGALSIDAGALRATHANALGTTAAGTTVASGAALELSGGISIGGETLGLSGTGISSGGALRNISGDNTYGGAITLNAATRINSDAGTLTLDVASGNAIAGTQNLTFGGAGNVTVNDPIATSTGTLTKDGAGTLALNAANTYTGTTTISTGSLKLGASGTLASTNISVSSGATFDLTSKTSGYSLGSGTTLGGSGTVTTASGQVVTVGTGATIQPGTATTSGNLTINGLTFDGGGTYKFSIGNVAGTPGTNWDLVTATQAFNITATSGSKFTINVAGNSGNPTGFINTQSFSWDILTLSAGSISGFDANAFDFVNGFTASNGSFNLTSDGTKLTLNYVAGTPLTVSYSSPSSTTWLTAGNWATASVPGAFDIAQFGANPSGTSVVINMNNNGGAQSVGAIEVTSARAAALTINNSALTAAGILTLNGATVNGTQNVILRNNSSQLLTLANGATANMGVALGNATDNKVVIDSTGGITISSAITGSGKNLTLTGIGSGTLTLSGANSYTGTTTVSAGSLLVNGDQSAANGAVSVASGAKLGGTGKIGGAVSVAGTLAPGASIESLSMGALSFSNGSTFAVELNSGVATSVGADLVVANGNLSLESPGTITLTLNDIAGSPVIFAEGTKFTLINYSGSWNNGLFTFGAGTLADGDLFAFGLNTWQIDYNATSGGSNFSTEYLPSSSFVNIEAVPEPSTYALLALSAAGLGAHIIRRRRR